MLFYCFERNYDMVYAALHKSDCSSFFEIVFRRDVPPIFLNNAEFGEVPYIVSRHKRSGCSFIILCVCCQFSSARCQPASLYPVINPKRC